jgi:hypothetical protein
MTPYYSLFLKTLCSYFFRARKRTLYTCAIDTHTYIHTYIHINLHTYCRASSSAVLALLYGSCWAVEDWFTKSLLGTVQLSLFLKKLGILIVSIDVIRAANLIHWNNLIDMLLKHVLNEQLISWTHMLRIDDYWRWEELVYCFVF